MTSYELLTAHHREAALWSGIAALVSWDQECFLPTGAAPWRAEQQAALAGMIHARRTDPRLGDWLQAAADQADPDQAANLRRLRRDYDRACRLPPALVIALAKARSEAYESWKAARVASNFARFAPDLQRILDLVREEADALGWNSAGGERYDALLEGFEPGTSTAAVAALLTPLAQEVARLLSERGHRPAPAIPRGHYPAGTQQALGEEVLDAIGFDRRRGRLDRTVHPFCTTLGPDDVRLTTRYREDDPLDALYSTLHEAGHGLYEQGLPTAQFGLPLGDAVSLGVHESQSRFWENVIGRGRGFAQWLLPRLQSRCAELGGWDATTLHAHLTAVAPGFIRVDADEVCYNLHIVLRFELERQLLNGTLAVTDLPAAWNARFERLLGLKVTDDAQGCLQDVHWSHAGIGYFPTYTLGNCYAAQLAEAATRDLGDLDQLAARGAFAPILAWLRERIHAHGCRYEAPELIRRATGQELSSAPLLRHLRRRYG